jgi:GntR family transcriptional regulator
VKGLLEDALERREWAPGEAIPSEFELAARFNVSQGTMRKAIAALAGESLVVRRQGKGTFVATHTEERASNFRFLRIRRNDGRDEYPASRLVDVRRGRAGAEAARALELRTGDPGHPAASRAAVLGRADRDRRHHAARRALPRPHARPV